MNTDLMFVLDISSSIQDASMNETVDFVTRFVRNLTIGPDDDRVGITVFGTEKKTQTLIYFHNYTEKCSLLRAIEVDVRNQIHSIRKEIQTTHTADGLNLTIKAFNSTARSHTTVLRTAIVLSDGVSEKKRATIKMAERLLNLTPNVLVYAIGVGKHVNKTELIKIAGSSDHYVHMDNFSRTGFDQAQTKFVSEICLKGMIIFVVCSKNVVNAYSVTL